MVVGTSLLQALSSPNITGMDGIRKQIIDNFRYLGLRYSPEGVNILVRKTYKGRYIATITDNWDLKHHVVVHNAESVATALEMLLERTCEMLNEAEQRNAKAEGDRERKQSEQKAKGVSILQEPEDAAYRETGE